MTTVGAGGGSIAWVDKGGALNVGPKSAAADPGPACYGLGGKLPTVTDANLLLGRLNPKYFLGGDIPLYPDRAENAIQENISENLDISIEEAAEGILRVVNANMVKGINIKSTQKGYDVREFSLIAFGGAGPLHAVDLAVEMEIPEVIVPPFCSTFSAFGLLVSDTRHDYVQTLSRDEKTPSPENLWRILHEMDNNALEQLNREGISKDAIQTEWFVDVRFVGQSYEIVTPVPKKSNYSKDDLEEIRKKFVELHQRTYTFGSLEEPTEFVNLRVVALGMSPEIKLPRDEKGEKDPKKAEKESRDVYFHGEGMVECPIYERDLMKPGNEVKGPCVIEERASSTIITPGSTAVIDEYRNIVVRINVK